jgi:DNA helicase-2/ATP-dependent DNA helicase PcrA
MTFRPTHEQQEIISYPPHHLRVAAGAGTGKTTTIVERLGQFVVDGVPPTRALGITFTVKAADELRNRLRERVGTTSDGEEVEVATYHGFAASILDEFGSLVGYDRSSLLLDDGHRSELMQIVLRETPTTLDLTAMKQRVSDVLEINDGLDSHLLNPQDMIDLEPEGGGDEDGPWPPRMQLLDAVTVYRSEKERLDLVEFSDLIRKAVVLVRDFPDVATELAGRYEVVLLDEYQDTDPAQRILLTSIFGPNASVTAVGDTDQTIYEWRGASLDNFAEFPKHFPRSDGQPTETLPLSLNRRSDRIILDMANEIRSHLPTLDDAEPLVARDGALDGELHASWFRSESEEADWIADDILERRSDVESWSDMAILVRKRAWIPLLVDALGKRDVPISVSDPGTLLQIPEIADVLAWLRIIADPDAEIALVRILMGGQYRLGVADLNALRLHARRIKAPTIMGAVHEHASVEGLDQRTIGLLARFSAIHERLMRFAQVNAVAASVDAIVDSIGFWDEVAALPPGESTSARLNIGRFMTIAQAWRPLEGRPSVSKFLRYLDALDQSGRDDALTPPTRVSSDAIELTTIHGAKGLEWDSVWVPGLQKGDFPMGTRKYDDPDNHATLIPYELRLDRDSLEAIESASRSDRKELLKVRAMDQEYRLAYVAVTRAKRRLVMTGHVWHDSVSRPKQVSVFLQMASEIPGVVVDIWCKDPGKKPELLPFSHDAAEPDPLFADGVSHAIRAAMNDDNFVDESRPDIAGAVAERIEQLALEIADLGVPAVEQTERPFSTSVTNLVALAECPLKFKWIHYDKMPRRPTKWTRKGTEFHRQVELHNLGIIALDDPSADVYDSVAHEAVEDQVADRTPTIDPWTVFESSRFIDLKARFAEVPFEVHAGTGSVRGKIDAIYEPEDGTWEVVDYKSGRRSDNPARRVQLQAYAVAVTEGAVSRDTPDALSVSFAYFGGSKFEEVTEAVDDTWLTTARIEIGRLVDQGANGPFDATPSAACAYCDFRHHCEPGKEWVQAHRRDTD